MQYHGCPKETHVGPLLTVDDRIPCPSDMLRRKLKPHSGLPLSLQLWSRVKKHLSFTPTASSPSPALAAAGWCTNSLLVWQAVAAANKPWKQTMWLPKLYRNNDVINIRKALRIVSHYDHTQSPQFPALSSCPRSTGTILFVSEV